MEYRRLGKSGLKVSALSFGSWVTFAKQVDVRSATQMMSAAKDHGINFFDNAEVYAGGKSEEIMGAVLREVRWPRLSYLISTKFFWGITDDVNGQNTLNRKYLLNGITGSLKRLGLDFVDLVYCHRPDPNTPISETVWAMHDMIQRGYALYWGTSEWGAREIREAIKFAEDNHLHKPIVEQPQYNLFYRHRVEEEYKLLYPDGLGLTTWSPLASGVLTGKYLKGTPKDSRASLGTLSWLDEMIADQKKQKQVAEFVGLAQQMDVSPAALAIAWCLKNPDVSTVITGASRPEQLKENIRALTVVEKLTDEVKEKIDRIFPVGDA